MQRILPLLNRVLLLLLVLLVFEEAFLHRLKIANTSTLIYTLIGIYVLLVVTELALNVMAAGTSKHRTPVSVRYLTKFFLFKKLVVNIVILSLGILSLYSNYATPEMRVFLFTVAGADILAFLARLLSGHYRAMIEEYTFSIVEDQEKVVNAGRIAEVAFRYDIFFFKLKDDDVKEVALESVQPGERKRFASEMLHWIEHHHIPLTAEARENLQKIL